MIFIVNLRPPWGLVGVTLAQNINFPRVFLMFLKVNVGPPMLPKTDQKTLQNHWVFYVLAENCLYQVCEMAFAWPSKSFKNQWKIIVFACVVTQKRLLGLILNHVAPSRAQNGFKMAQDGSRLLQEGHLGSRHKQKVNIPMVFLMIFNVNLRPPWGLVGATLAQSINFPWVFKCF